MAVTFMFQTFMINTVLNVTSTETIRLIRVGKFMLTVAAVL